MVFFFLQITETYAFLPREAVTRFLLGCTDCQKRPRTPSPLDAKIQNNFTSIADLSKSTIPTNTPSPQDLSIEKTALSDYQKTFENTLLQLNKSTSTPEPSPKRSSNPLDVSNLTSKDPPKIFTTPKKRYLGPLRRHDYEKINEKGSADTSSLNFFHPNASNDSNGLDCKRNFKAMESNIDLNLPITTTYLKHMRTLGYTDEDALKFERYVSDIFLYNSIMLKCVPELQDIAYKLHVFLTELLRQIHF